MTVKTADLIAVLNSGASPDTSHRYVAVVLKLTEFSVTRLLLECCSWSMEEVNREKLVD